MTTAAVVMVSNRPDQLDVFLRSLRVRYGDQYPVFVHMQGSTAARVPDGLTVEQHITPDSVGCHAARVVALREMHSRGWDPDVCINVDDDVTLLSHTHWGPAVERAASEPGCGFVLTNWVRHPNQIAARAAAMEDRFYRQIMLYNGGGMAYSREVAALMRGLPAVPARYDDIWPLTAYLEGYRSYRYQGSLALHAIMSKGGMNDYMRSEPRPLLCEDWVVYRHLHGAPVGSDYAIPADSDLRPEARERHIRSRREKGWPE